MLNAHEYRGSTTRWRNRFSYWLFQLHPLTKGEFSHVIEDINLALTDLGVIIIVDREIGLCPEHFLD